MIVQDQVLIGTILGGSSLIKSTKGVNYYLSMSSKNKKWLIYKISEMPDIFNNFSIRCYSSTYKCNSRCCEKLTYYRKEMYESDNRRITMELLDKLRDIGIAIWYLDSGGKAGRNRKNAYINTTKFGKEGTYLINQYFNEVDIPCNVNRDGKRLKVLFTISGTESLYSVIGGCIPEFMINYE